MLRHLAHRGPDGEGRFCDRIRRPDGAVVDVLLVHRRLAVIDPGGGRQPMVSSEKVEIRAHGADGSAPPPPQGPPPAAADDLVAVVFNGCIYNHRALRAELEKGGRKFRTDHSDTEAILQGFRAWGMAAPSHLEGMFGLGVWDRRHGRMMLARDRAGEKPLYMAEFSPDGASGGGDGSCLAFASTVPALVAVMREGGDACDMVDSAALSRWIRFGYDAELPIVGIRTLRQGHTASTSEDMRSWVTREYYAPPVQRDPARVMTLDELDRVLGRAVTERLESDVPLGCFLSGGIDSSLIAAYASKAKPGLKTFCVRMPDPRYDESVHARAVARRISSRHTTLEVSAKPAQDLCRLVEQLGLPLGDSSLLPTYWVSAAARKHVTVALSGDGGDELFMGYERYRAADLLRDYGPMFRLLPERFLGRSHPRTRRNKLSRMATAAKFGGYEELLSIFTTPELARLLPGVDPEETMVARGGVRIADPSRHDVSSYLPEDLLRKVDTASMSVALEVRSPLLATAVMEAALSLSRKELAGGGPKSLLRALARRHLPDAIVQRPKSGFAIPVGEWFRSDYGKIRTLLGDLAGSSSAWSGLGLEINRRAVQEMMEEHASARRDHGQRLYLLTVLGVWKKWLLG